MPKQIAGWQHVIETLHEGRSRSLPGRRLNPWYPVQVRPILAGRLQHGNDHRLTFTFEHSVDAAVSMLQDLGTSEGSTVATDHNQGLRQKRAGRLRQVDDFRHIGQIIARENHRVGRPRPDPAKVVLVSLCL